MKEQFQAHILRAHFGETDRWNGEPLHEAIFAKWQELGVAGAIVYRGIEGYGTNTRIRHSRHWKFCHDAPIMLSVVDTGEQTAGLLPHLDKRVDEDLIAMSNVEVIRYVRLDSVPSQG